MDNAIGLGIILSLQDRASAGLEKIRNKMTALRDVSQDMMKRFDEGAKQMIAGFGAMVSGAKVLGVLESTFGVSVTTAADFEQAMARVSAVSGAVGEDFEKLTKQARDLGRDTQYSASQVANAQELLARGGFITNEIISAMPNLLYMAGAEGMEMARAADIAVGTLRGFGLEASEMARVANVLAKASATTNTSINTLGESFKYVAPDARMLKVSIEEVAAIVGVMGDANIKASQAGAYLRGAFNRLVSPTTKAQAALDKLGISVKDKNGELKSFDTLMGEFSEKMQGMTGFQKKELFGQIFDARSSTGMMAVLAGFESGKLSKSIEVYQNAENAAKAMYDRMSATLQGAQARLDSATEGMRIAIGNHLLPVVTRIIDGLAQFKSWLTQLIEAHPVIAKAVIGFTAALIGLSGAALLVVGGLASISGFIKMWPLLKIMAISALSNIRTQVRLALASFTKLSVPIVALIALAGALFYAWRKNLWGIRDMVTAVAEGFKMALSASTDGIAEVDEELANKLKAAGIWDFAVTMGKVFFRVRQFWNGLVEGFNEGLDFLKEGFEWLKDIFAPVIKSGQELLKFLGILKPVTKTQADTWKAWGQLFGRLVPIIGGVILAFKGFNIISGIFGTLGQAIMSVFSLIMTHPVIAVIVALVAAGIYLYNHWEEISEWFAGLWNDIADCGRNAAEWIKQKWQEFSDWWDSWTLADVFAGIYDSALSLCSKIKQPFIDFKDWLLDLFANLNPFNRELPSWLGGGKAGDNQVKNAENAGTYLPPSIPPAKTVTPANVQPKIPVNLLPPKKFTSQPVKVNPKWAEGMQELNARTGLNLDIPTVNIPESIVNVASTKPPAPIVNVPPAKQATPVVNVPPAKQATPVVNIPPAKQAVNVSQNVPLLQNSTVSVEQTDISGLSSVLTGIEEQLGAVVGRDIEVKLPAVQQQSPSSPLLIQHTQNQATMNGQATVQAQSQSTERPVKVDNHVDVKVESRPVEIVLDGEKVGSAALRWVERQNLRSGVSEF